MKDHARQQWGHKSIYDAYWEHDDESGEVVVADTHEGYPSNLRLRYDGYGFQLYDAAGEYDVAPEDSVADEICKWLEGFE